MAAQMGRMDVVKEFEERVISIDRVSRVVKGGRRFRFRTTVVIGDGKGRVGVGVGKGSEVMTSIQKAVAIAKKSMITVPMRGTSIPHEVHVRFCGAEIMLKPASEGTGVIAGGAVRAVVEAAGIHDLLTKSFGSTNKVNNAYAAIMALNELQLSPYQAAQQTAKSSETKADAASVAETVEAKPETEKKAPAQAKTTDKKPVAKKSAAKAPAKKTAAKPKEATS